MDKIIVFGATGSLGVYTTTILKQHGFDVIAVGRRDNDNGFFKEHDIEYINLDISNDKSFKKLPESDIFGVIHLAGIYPGHMHGYFPVLYVDSIIKGSLNILEYSRNTNADRIIFAHSRADSNYLMGTLNLIPSDIEKKFPLKGDHSVYSICKNTVVDLIEHYEAEYGLKGFVLRLPTIYLYTPDPYFYVNGKKKWIAYRWIINQAIKGEPIEVWGNPDRRKEIIYIKDFVQIVEKCLITNIKRGGVYNVGSGVGVTLQEQIKGIIQIFNQPNKKSKLIYFPEKPDARQFIHDISKTVKDLGYRQEYDYISLLKDFKKEMEINPFSKILGNAADFQEL